MEPAELLEGILKGQKKFLSGYGGAKTTDPERLAEAQEPGTWPSPSWASPPFIPISRVDRSDLTTRHDLFLVSNATHPEVLEELRPTQLYLSLNAPDVELYRRVCNPAGDLWPMILASLEILKEHRCRSVIRMTLAKGLNMVQPEDYARVIETGEPDFVEVKAYMHLGRSRARLEREAMPGHDEILAYARTLADALGYNLEAEVPLSRVALLSSRRLPRSLDL